MAAVKIQATIDCSVDSSEEAHQLGKELEDRLHDLCEFANATHTTIFLHPIIRAIILHFLLGEFVAFSHSEFL